MPSSGQFTFYFIPTTLFVNRIVIHDITKDGANIGEYLQIWDDSTCTIKGHIIIKSNTNDDSTYCILEVYELDDLGNEVSIGVSMISGTLPTDLEECVLEFIRNGDCGTSGTSGTSGLPMQIDTYTIVNNTSFYTWTRPVWANEITVICIGGGGGAGAGGVGSIQDLGQTSDYNEWTQTDEPNSHIAYAICGGSGGGGASIVIQTFLATQLAPTALVIVGAGGLGGKWSVGTSGTSGIGGGIIGGRQVSTPINGGASLFISNPNNITVNLLEDVANNSLITVSAPGGEAGVNGYSVRLRTREYGGIFGISSIDLEDFIIEPNQYFPRTVDIRSGVPNSFYYLSDESDNTSLNTRVDSTHIFEDFTKKDSTRLLIRTRMKTNGGFGGGRKKYTPVLWNYPEYIRTSGFFGFDEKFSGKIGRKNNEITSDVIPNFYPIGTNSNKFTSNAYTLDKLNSSLDGISTHFIPGGNGGVGVVDVGELTEQFNSTNAIEFSKRPGQELDVPLNWMPHDAESIFFGCTGGGGGAGIIAESGTKNSYDTTYIGGKGGSIFGSWNNNFKSSNTATSNIVAKLGGIASTDGSRVDGTSYPGHLIQNIGLGGAGGTFLEIPGQSNIKGDGGNGGNFGGGGGGGAALIGFLGENFPIPGDGGNGGNGIVIVISK